MICLPCHFAKALGELPCWDLVKILAVGGCRWGDGIEEIGCGSDPVALSHNQNPLFKRTKWALESM